MSGRGKGKLVDLRNMVSLLDKAALLSAKHLGALSKKRHPALPAPARKKGKR